MKERRPSLLALVGLAAGLLALAGCSVGSYPVDYFQEMHYSPAVRLQEPLRLSSPGVTFQGAGVGTEVVAGPAYDRMPRAQLEALPQNPLANSDALRAQGQALFARNCAVCHGAAGDGKGAPIVVAQFQPAGASPPADLTAQSTRGRTDGAIFGIITHGQGTVPAPADAKNAAAYQTLTNMPGFRKLLTADERWALVRYIRTLQGQ